MLYAAAKHKKSAPVAELVDALDLGSSVPRRVGSSPIRRTGKEANRLILNELRKCLFFIVNNLST